MGNLGIEFIKFIEKAGPVITHTRPALPFNTTELRLAPELTSDICKFSYDRALCPKFLDSLLEVKDINTVKNMILEQKGYKTAAESVRIESINGISAGFGFDSGAILIPHDLEQAKKIAFTMHEIDHLDKSAKIIKACGYDKYEKAVKEGYSRFFTDELTFNRELFERLSKDADIEGFDSQEYLEGLRNYTWNFNSMDFDSAYKYFLHMQEYCINKMEESAYRIQKKVMNHFEIFEPTTYEVYVNEFGKVQKLLEPFGSQKEEIFANLKDMSIIIEYPNGKNILKSLKNPETLTKEEIEEMKKMLFSVKSFKDIQLILNQTESWLKDGILTLDDVLKTF